MEPKLKIQLGSNGRISKIDGNLFLNITHKPKYWIAFSPHFKTFGQSSESAEDAVEDFKLALNTFFDVHDERGTLDKALEAFGWVKLADGFESTGRFNIPSYLLSGLQTPVTV